MLVGCDVFFYKQKTAYEMRISDWSSDVCSSDLGWELGRTELIAIGAMLVWIIATAIARFRMSFFGIALRAQRETVPAAQASGVPVINLRIISLALGEIGRASCRERVCQYV